MSPQMADSADADRFKELFSLTERDLLAYALRRVERPEDAADVWPRLPVYYVGAMSSGDWYGRPLIGELDDGLGCDTLGVDLP